MHTGAQIECLWSNDMCLYLQDGNYILNFGNQPALLKEGIDCSHVIDYKDLFKRETKSVYLSCQSQKIFGAKNII